LKEEIVIKFKRKRDRKTIEKGETAGGSGGLGGKMEGLCRVPRFNDREREWDRAKGKVIGGEYAAGGGRGPHVVL